MISNESKLISSPIQNYLEQLHARLHSMTQGKVATYIPELGKANPSWFGICMVTVDGKIYTVGDTEQTFTIQSISKPFTYGLALEDNGQKEVLEKVWVEPSGEAFNSISLDPTTGRPVNPMINAGAIATTSLVKGKSTQQKIRRILNNFSLYAGRSLEIDHSVYSSESLTGHRNRAIGHMLRNFEIIGEDPKASLEAYFLQCSILVNCKDLGIMAATLANGGVNPVTQKRAVQRPFVESILSVMGSCGMYDAAGEWIYNVGLPAKSGVAGGILAVLPGQLGIGVFSPLLDSHGNSHRGIEVCRELSRTFDLHMFNTTQLSRSTIRHRSSANEINSKRLRSEREVKILQSVGAQILKLEVQGDLTFSSAEILVREIIESMKPCSHLVIDLGHVRSIDEAALSLLSGLAKNLHACGKVMISSAADRLPKFKNASLKKNPLSPAFYKHDSDLALEWCENELIKSQITPPDSHRRIALCDCELLKNFSPSQLSVFEKLLIPCKFKNGDKIIRTGDKSDKLYFLMKGEGSVWITLRRGSSKRIATFLPGMSFGEMSLLDQSSRSAEVRADSPMELLFFPKENLKILSNEHPIVLILLLHNLSLVLARRLRKANEEISFLSE